MNERRQRRALAALLLCAALLLAAIDHVLIGWLLIHLADPERRRVAALVVGDLLEIVNLE